MYKITVKGEAKTEYPNLTELDGISCQDEFSEYFDGDESYVGDVNNGYLYFKYEDGKLWSITTYDSTRELTQKELEELKEYTTGQWSDGIGEGFEQFPCHTASQPYRIYEKEFDDYENQDEANEDLEVYISPWFFEQIITITQELINV